MQKMQFKRTRKKGFTMNNNIKPTLKQFLGSARSKKKDKKVENLNVEENIAITKLTDKIKEIEHSQKILKQHSKCMDNEILKTTKKIESTFIQIIDDIEKRKMNLLKELTKISETEKKKLDKKINRLQQEFVSSNKKLIQCQEIIKNGNIENRKEKLMEISANVCKIDCNVPYAKNHKFISYDLDTMKLNKMINIFGDISRSNEMVPILLSLQQRDTEKLNKISIKWRLNENEENEKKENNKISHKLRIECAYLPFDHDINIEEEKDFECDFVDNLDINLAQNALNENNESMVTIEIPKQPNIYIFRLKYSMDGISWTNYSNYKYLKFSPKSDINKLDLKFIEKKHGKYLKFDSQKNSVKCIYHDNLYHTVLFGMEIKKSLCCIFKIKYKINNYGLNKKSSDFFIGFGMRSHSESILNYDQALGCGLNKKYSIGIRVRGQQLFLYDHSNSKTKINYQLKGNKSFKINDNFRFIFNFNNNTWYFYHNIRLILKRKLNTNCIIPAVTLGNKEEEIQIVEWQFI